MERIDNMEQLVIDSKIYITPTKGRTVLKILLNAFLLCYAILTFFLLLMDGFSIVRIGEFCLAALVISYYNTGNKPGYQFSVLNASILENEMQLVYNHVKVGSQTCDIRVRILREGLESVEYSGQLKAVRLAGKVIRELNGVQETLKDFIIYTGNDSGRFLQQLKNSWACEVKYMA